MYLWKYILGQNPAQLHPIGDRISAMRNKMGPLLVVYNPYVKWAEKSLGNVVKPETYSQM